MIVAMEASTHIVNGIGHFDVAGPDLAPLQRFYAEVFGWTVEPMGPGYAQVHTPTGAPDGALVEAPEASLTIGVVVADLQHALDAAVAGGGEIVMPATDNGFVIKGQVADPAGNRITLLQR
jgi:predicted enzyme related to lactoylglutathione lyase